MPIWLFVTLVLIGFVFLSYFYVRELLFEQVDELIKAQKELDKMLEKLIETKNDIDKL